MSKKYWLDYGDIDHGYEFACAEQEPEGVMGVVYGPFDTFKEAKQELLAKLRDDRDMLNSVIGEVARAKRPLPNPDESGSVDK